jgi:hypothetical protein
MMSREDAQKKAEGLSSRWECLIVRVTPTHIVTVDYT